MTKFKLTNEDQRIAFLALLAAARGVAPENNPPVGTVSFRLICQGDPILTGTWSPRYPLIDISQDGDLLVAGNHLIIDIGATRPTADEAYVDLVTD